MVPSVSLYLYSFPNRNGKCPRSCNFQTPTCRPLHLQSGCLLSIWMDIFNALNSMVPSVSLYLYSFPNRKGNRQIGLRQAVLRWLQPHLIFQATPYFPAYSRIPAPRALIPIGLSLRDRVTWHYSSWSSEISWLTHEISEFPREWAGCNPSSRV